MLQKVFKEPLFQFMTLSFCLFLIYFFFNPREENEITSSKVVVNDAVVNRISSIWMAKWQRKPTPFELKNLINEYVREEILFRKGMELGFDKNDEIIKRRIVQKVEMMAEQLTEIQEVSEKDLKDFYNKHTQNYIPLPSMDFGFVYINPELHKNPKKYAEGVLKQIKNQNLTLKTAPKGDDYSLSRKFINQDKEEIEKNLGGSFADNLFDKKHKGWFLIESDYGFHIVNISKIYKTSLMKFKDVRNIVKSDYEVYRVEQMQNIALERFKKEYQIVYKFKGQEHVFGKN